MLGTPEVPQVEGLEEPQQKRGPAKPFLVLGLGGKELGQGPSGQEASVLDGASAQGPYTPYASALHLARCHFFSVKATAQAPNPPPSGQSLAKIPPVPPCA